MNIESRRLIKFGKSSFVVSLPQSWIRRLGLSKGDRIYVTDQDDNLILSSKKERRGEPTNYLIDATDKSIKALRTEIVSAYLNNYDIITIKSHGELEKAVEIRGILQNLAGLEILEQTQSKIVAKDLIDIRELSIHTLVRRIDIIARSMLTDILDDVANPPYKSIFQRDQDVNRLVYLTFRVLRKALLDPTIRKQMDLSILHLLRDRLVIARLEKVADFTKRTARHLIECKLDSKARNELKKILSSTYDSYLQVMSAYFSEDMKLALEVELGKEDRMDLCNRFMRRYMTVSVTEALENIKNMNAAVSHIARNVMSSENPNHSLGPDALDGK